MDRRAASELRQGEGDAERTAAEAPSAELLPLAAEQKSPALTSLIGYQLRRVHTQSTSALEVFISQLDLRAGHYAVMAAIEAQPGMTQNQICATINLRPGNLTPVLNELVGRGFVVRRRDEKDKRIARIYLEPAGFAVLGELHRRVLQHEAGFYAPLSPDEKDLLMRLLNRLGAP